MFYQDEFQEHLDAWNVDVRQGDIFSRTRSLAKQLAPKVYPTLDAKCFAMLAQCKAVYCTFRDVDFLLPWKQWALEGHVVLSAAATAMLTWSAHKISMRAVDLVQAVTSWVKFVVKTADGDGTDTSTYGFVLVGDTVLPRAALCNAGKVVDVLYLVVDVLIKAPIPADLYVACNALFTLFEKFAHVQKHVLDEGQMSAEYAVATRLADAVYETSHAHKCVLDDGSLVRLAYFARVPTQRELVLCVHPDIADVPIMAFKGQVDRWSVLRAAWARAVISA